MQTLTLKQLSGMDAHFHITPDIVAVEESNTPHTNTKVTLVDITSCLENRIAQAIANKRSHYAPLRRALMDQGHDVPQIAAMVMCVRGSVLTSTLKALEDLGINRNPAEALLRKTHIAACDVVSTCSECATHEEPLGL